MEEKLIFLFQRLIQSPTEDISDVNLELNSLYHEADTLFALFSLFEPNNSKEIRTLSGCGIKTTLINILYSLTDSDLAILKQAFLDLFQIEQDLEILNIVINASSIIFSQWPEIFDFIQSLIDSSEEDNNESNQLAMALMSQIPEELYNQEIGKYIEMCTILISFSLDHQTNCYTALELFSSISHFYHESDDLHELFSNFYIKFLNLFQEYLINNDSDCFKIAKQLIKSIEFIEIDDTSNLLIFLIELGKESSIKSKNKISILNVIETILKKQIIPDLFEDILQLAIECSSSLFDEFCYIENEASLVSFHFLNYFNSIENFEEILIQNLITTSNDSIFASLLALSSLLSENSGPISDTFISFILSCCEIENHSILEQSFSIFLNTDIDQISEEMLEKIIVVTLNSCMPSSGHSELQSIVVELIAYFLFNKKIPDEMCDDLFSMLMELFEQDDSIFVKDKIILCFAGFTECFDSEKVEQLLPLFVPLLIDSAKSFDLQCVLCQAAAVESLSLCISHFRDYFDDISDTFTSFLLSWIDDIENRHHVTSAIYSLKKLISSGVLNDEEILDNVIQTAAKYLSQSASNEIDLGIDDSGISFEEMQVAFLSLIRSTTKYIFKNKNSIEIDFFLEFLPNFISILCESLDSSAYYQENVMKTIYLICRYCYRGNQDAVLAFSDFFLSIFENNLDLAIRFFSNIFNSNICISYPDEFFQDIYSKSLQELNEGNNQIILLFEFMSDKFDIFPIDEFIEIIENNSSQLSGEDTSRAVSVFCNYLTHNAITQDNTSTVEEIMSISFDSLHLCTNFSIKPSPIRLLSLLLSLSFDFNDQIISQFYPIFTKIFNNSSDPDLQTKFIDETICESILFLLKVIATLPNISFPFELFFPKIFYFIPFEEAFPSNSDILFYLPKLPRNPNFSKLAPYFDDLFACLIRTISLNDDIIYEIGIESKSFSGIVKFAFEMLRAQQSRIQIIKEIASEDPEKINNIQSRINNYAHNSNFLQLDDI